jgi:hypothetical protein
MLRISVAHIQRESTGHPAIKQNTPTVTVGVGAAGEESSASYFFLLPVISQGPQHTGMLPIVTQQTQPVTQQVQQQSAQLCTTWQQVESPVVQEMQTPSEVFSTVHMQQQKLQQQTQVPFIMTLQPTIWPICIMHRFCTMETATGSLQLQWILTPVLHFSNLMTPRGTIIMFGAVGIIDGKDGVVIGLPTMVGIIPIMPVRSIVIEEETTGETPFHQPPRGPRSTRPWAAAVFILQYLRA